MKNTQFLAKLGSVAKSAGHTLSKHSPEIFIIAGIVGTVTSAVLACKATLQVNDILDEAKENIDEIHEREPEENVDTETKKELAIAYAQTGIKLVKLYAPSVILGALSITSIVTSNKILAKRNVALSAALATVSKGFEEYRERVVKKYGPEVDQALRYNLKDVKIEETVTDEDGKERKVKKTVPVVEEKSDYIFYYDQDSMRGSTGNIEHDMAFLRGQQKYANDKLITDGRLFLNDVLESMGGNDVRTKAGQVLGWVYDPTDKTIDNKVDFRMKQVYKKTEDGYKPTILLDFNCDGDVWKSMTK